TKFLPTLYKKIDLTIDLKTRSAALNVPGVVEGKGNSIRNESSGKDVPARIIMPVGFEFHEAEFISGKGKTANGSVHLDFDGAHDAAVGCARDVAIWLRRPKESGRRASDETHLRVCRRLSAHPDGIQCRRDRPAVCAGAHAAAVADDGIRESDFRWCFADRG